MDVGERKWELSGGCGDGVRCGDGGRAASDCDDLDPPGSSQ